MMSSQVTPPVYKQTKVGVIPEDWNCLSASNYFFKCIVKGYEGLVVVKKQMQVHLGELGL